MITEGYIKIWRALLTKPIWLNSTSDQRSILIAIIAVANWQENKWEWKGKPYECKPGEFISSYKKIAKIAGKGVSDRNVRTAIKRFKNLDFLSYLTTNGWNDGIKVIITNWDEYQKEPVRPADTLLTDGSQTAVTSLTTNEEGEEYKNTILSYKENLEKFLKRNSDFGIYGEYTNVFLSKRQIGYLTQTILNEKKINNYIESLSKNIASTKEKEFDFIHTEMHKIRILDYYNHEKNNLGRANTKKHIETVIEGSGEDGYTL